MNMRKCANEKLQIETCNMPRRKGYGNPPVTHVEETESNNSEPSPNRATIDSARYLHKKFKKMAAVSSDDDNLSRSTSNSSVTTPAPMVPRTAEANHGTNDDTSAYISLPAFQPACSPVALPLCLPRVITTAAVATTSITAALPSTAAEDKPAGATSLTGVGGRYVCSYCKLVCNKPSVLQKHIRAHTNERPYPCLPCGLAFKTRSNLYKHCRSRSHSLKIEDQNGSSGSGIGRENDSDFKRDSPVLADEEDDTKNDDENNNNEDSEVGDIKRSDQTCVTSIYKPKFHKYIQNNGGKGFATMSTATKIEQKLVLTKLHPTPNRLEYPLQVSPATSSVQASSCRLMPPTSSSFNSSSSSTEFLQKHISKLINENQAIVETNDSFRSRKFYQRSKENVSPQSPLSTMISSSSLSSTSSLERMTRTHLHPSPQTRETVTEEKLTTMESKSPTVLTRSEFVVNSIEMSHVSDTLNHVADSSSSNNSNGVIVTSSASEESQPLNLTMNKKEMKFVRPTSLPLQPDTFVPKKLLSEFVTMLPLISPETPRSNKSYGQFYIGDNAYTYLGLKSSTRNTFCTLHKSQPTYVSLGPEHNKISMYSNWKVRSEVDPYFHIVSATCAMASYDSRQRYSPYTTSHTKKKDAVTHSSYWSSGRTLKGFAGSRKYLSNNGSEEGTHPSEFANPSSENLPTQAGNDDEEHGDEDETEEYSKDDTKCQLEQEVARSLLSLSKISRQKVSEQYAIAGLVSMNARPNTYPYNCSANISSKPQTATSMLISEQNERETLLRNTGLARELQSAALNSGKTIMQEFDMPAQLRNHRYYFGSSSQKEVVAKFTSDLPNLVCKDSATVISVFPIDLRKDKVSTTDGTLNTVSSSVTTVVSNFPKINIPISKPVALETICSIPDRSLARTKESEPPIWSSVPIKADVATGESTHMSSTYSEECVAQDLQMKQQYQSPHLEIEQRNFDVKFKVHPNEALQKGKEAAVVAQTTAMTTSSYLDANPVSKSVFLDDAIVVRPTSSPTRKNYFVFESNDAKKFFPVRNENNNKNIRLKRISDSDPKENYTLAPMNSVVKSDDSSASTVVFASNSNAVSNNVAKKLKTEFIAPSGGPLPEYAILLEDGRSKCVVCNKVFSKLSQLLLHVNIHYFEQPFRCESCAVSFRTKGHLHKHLGSNAHLNKVSMNSTGNAQTLINDPRPFKCVDCNLGFRIHGHLAKHLRSKLHIMKLECVGKLPFGTYTEIERCGISLLNDIDTTDYENYLKHLQRIAKGIVNSDD